MTVLLYRVDNRLVHGQVLEGWMPRLGADTVIVVDEERAADSFQCAIFENLGQQGVTEVCALSPLAALDVLESERFRRRKVIVLFYGLPEAQAAWRAGLRFDSLNLGNLHPREGSRSLTGSVHLTEEDEKILLRFAEEDVRLDARAVPTDASPDVVKFCRSRVEG
jgi:PTS system mannose-specific IIB component